MSSVTSAVRRSSRVLTITRTLTPGPSDVRVASYFAAGSTSASAPCLARSILWRCALGHSPDRRNRTSNSAGSYRQTSHRPPCERVLKDGLPSGPKPTSSPSTTAWVGYMRVRSLSFLERIWTLVPSLMPNRSISDSNFAMSVSHPVKSAPGET
jgi:hypothetical protein